MNKPTTKEIQAKILEIFKIFKKICDKYDLKYFAIGGTCIGAVRHKGFIPWDDDLDVAMPIESYKKFREIAKMELKPPLELLDYLNENQEYQLLSFFKIQNTNTTFVETCDANRTNSNRGVFIDVFPITGCPTNKIKQKRYLKKLLFITRLNNVRNRKYEEKTSFKGKAFWKISYLYMKGKPKNFFLKKWENLLCKYNFTSENDILFPWRIPTYDSYKNVFPYDYFKDFVELKFEDTTIKVPIEYDKYLKMDFGDYMTLPPIEKRCSNHQTIEIDLNKPFEQYKKENLNFKD